jgi:PAS domain S-box-containing protein
MIDRIKRWLTPPTFQGEVGKTLRARLLHITLLSVIGFLVIAIIGNWLGGRTPATLTGLDALLIIVCLLFYYWTRQGRVGLVSVGLMTLGIITITLAVASLGTIRTPATAAYLTLVIVGGLLFDLRGIVVMTTLSSLAILGLIGAENAGLLPTPDLSVTVTQWITYTALFGSSGGLTIMVLRMTRQALERADSEIAARARAGAQLRESEARFRAIAENTPAGYFLIDRAGRFQQVNAAWLRMHGYASAEEVIGKHFALTQIEMDQKAAQANVARLLSGEPIPTGEFSRRCKDGSVGYHEFTANPVVHGGQVVGLEGFLIDITERKRADQALRESEARFRELFENANDIVYTHDLAGNFTSINRATEQVTGYARDEALTMNIAQVIAPEYLEPSRQWLDPKGIGQGPLTHELEIITKDGRRVLLELGTRLIFREGKPVGVQGIARDITARKRAEAALAQERNLLHTLFDHLPDSVWIKDTESRFVMGNLGVTRHVGAATPEEIIGKSDFDFFPKDLAEQYYADEQQDVRSGQPLLNREEIVEDQTTGKRLWNLVTKVPLRNAAGNIVGLVGIGRDITERKRAAEALRASEERHRLLIESIRDSVYVLDKEWRHLVVNQAAAKYTGIPADKLLGAKLGDLFPGVENTSFFKTFQQVMTTRTADTVINEYTFVDGRKGWYEVNVYPTPEGILCISRDITERKRAEEALRASEEKYRALVENATDFIYLLDRENRVLAVNLAGIEVLGKKLDEITGRSVFELFPQEIAQQFSSELKAVFESGKPRFSETKMVAGGREFWISVNLSPVRNQAGEVESVMGMSRDITERKQAEEVLQRSHNELEKRVQERTAELQRFVDLAAGREIRMAELKNVIKQLRAQLQVAGMVPVADDPLAAGME